MVADAVPPGTTSLLVEGCANAPLKSARSKTRVVKLAKVGKSKSENNVVINRKKVKCPPLTKRPLTASAAVATTNKSEELESSTLFPKLSANSRRLKSATGSTRRPHNRHRPSTISESGRKKATRPKTAAEKEKQVRKERAKALAEAERKKKELRRAQIYAINALKRAQHESNISKSWFIKNNSSPAAAAAA